MKLQLALLILCFSGYTPAQVFNRAYINFDYGFKKHGDMGLVLHVFNHFSIAGYAGITKFGVGPYYAVSEGFPFGKNEQLKNKYDSKYLLAGVTTRMLNGFEISCMAGPSWMDGIEYSNIELHKHEDSKLQYPTFDRQYKNGIGCAIRVDLLLEVTQKLGLNTGVQYNLNPVRNEFTIQLGINIGIVRDYSDGDWGMR